MNYFTDLIRAKYVKLAVHSHEYERIKCIIVSEMRSIGKNCVEWNPTIPLTELMRNIDNPTPQTVFIVRDFHHFLKKDTFTVMSKLKAQTNLFQKNGNALIIISPCLEIPSEMEKEITIVDIPMPDRSMFRMVMSSVCNIEDYSEEEISSIVESSSGLTSIEAQDVYALSLVKNERIKAVDVQMAKEQIIKKSGLLEIIHTPAGVNDIGGLDNMKKWLEKRRKAFFDHEKAKAFGLPIPKGILIAGVPGTGKSLSAKACANMLQLPLIRFDLGSIFTSLMGESEHRLRQVEKLIEVMSPCILWIEEIDKMFGGSGGERDGGTSARIFGRFLTWMQEREEKGISAFIVATANDISKLPPEFIRKGRFDEVFFVDLPTATEREMIWAIQLGKHKLHEPYFDIPSLSVASEGMTGSEIEAAICEGMHTAFANGMETTHMDVIEALMDIIPLSRTMEKKITALREWGRTNAKPASLPVKAACDEMIA